MTKQGAFTFVLHSHLPYTRRAGRWPHGEEWIHEAMAETYVPLVRALYDLRDEGRRFKLTIGVTPVLAEQLADPLIKDHFEAYLDEEIRFASEDVARFRKAGEGHFAYLADFYLQFYQGVRDAFEQRFQRDVIGALRALADEGFVEIATSAATHGYLPLLDRDSSIHGQLAVGKKAYERHFGQRPSAIWLPECAYRPAYFARTDHQQYVKPGIEDFLQALDIRCFFSETHTIEGGKPVGKATGQVIGPYGSVPKRYLVPHAEYSAPTERTTYQAYRVDGSEVAVIGRNERVGQQVWSAAHGYPGDFWYREFHKKDGVSGLQYWRVTGAAVDLGSKDCYDPYKAQERVLAHSRHYAQLVADELAAYRARSDAFGIISAAYDTELFGHWWFEGVDWLKEVLRQLSESATVELTTASTFIDQHPPQEALELPESSWGQGGNHFTWMNADTAWMWPIIHQAEVDMEALVARHPRAQGDHLAVLQQAARELLLLESSDWPFLVTTGQAKEYAEGRFLQHVERFNELKEALLLDGLSREAVVLAGELYEMDNIFPDIDYRAFAEREQMS